MKRYQYVIQVKVPHDNGQFFLADINFQKQPKNSFDGLFNVLGYDCDQCISTDVIHFDCWSEAMKCIKNIKRFRRLEKKLIPTEKWTRLNYKFKLYRVEYDSKAKIFLRDFNWEAGLRKVYKYREWILNK